MDKLNNLIKISVIIGILLISGSISYYYVFFLPQQERMKAYNASQKEIEKQIQENLKAYSESQRKMELQKCRAAAEASANDYLELNGTPVPDKPGVYSALRYVHDKVAKIKQEGFNDCQRMYGDLR